MKIFITKKVEIYLGKRNLHKKFKKCLLDLKDGNLKKVDFKKRKPKSDNIFQFRIDKKFRAFGYLQGEVFFIFSISDHQN